MKLKLELDVEINAEGLPTEYFVDNLRQVVKDAMSQGTVTGDSEATLESFGFRIVEMDGRREARAFYQ